MDGDASAGGLGMDHPELVLGALDQDHPAPAVLRNTGFCLVKSGGNDAVGVVLNRGGEPFRTGLWSFAWSAASGRGE
jgi:hypothetical protein